MGLLDSLLSAGGGGAIAQIARQLGIPEPLAQVAATALLPALTRGLQRNTSQPAGLSSLVSALSSGQHEQYVDNPQTLTQSSAIDDGNAILGHILGSKDVSRNVAAQAAEQTGIDPSTLKKMLPMLGAAAMGTLSKEVKNAQQPGAAGAAGQAGNPLGALSSLIGDGAAEGNPDLDDLLGMAKKLF